MLIFLQNNEVNHAQWKNLLANSETASPFQTPEFYQYTKVISGYDSHFLGLSVSNELKIAAVITIQREPGISSWFSRRAIIHGGPLFSKNTTSSEIDYFLKEIENYVKKKAIYFEIRNYFDFSAYKNVFLQNGWTYLPHLNTRISTANKSVSEIKEQFKYNRRRELKQTIDSGVCASECKDLNELRGFYKLLKETYSKSVGLPLPGFDFFEILWKKGFAKIFLAKHENEIIGGSFCPVLENKVIYSMYYCGKRDYHPKIFPTHVVVMAAIEYAILNDIPVFDFMGAGKPGEEYGVRKYKQAFGGDTVEYGRFILVINPFLFSLGKMVVKTKQLLSRIHK